MCSTRKGFASAQPHACLVASALPFSVRQRTYIMEGLGYGVKTRLALPDASSVRISSDLQTFERGISTG